MKATRLLGGGNTGFQVDAGAALFVHDAELDGADLQAQHLLDAGEQLGGKRHLSGAVHLGLDDVDRALARVANGVFLGAGQVVHGDGGGHHRVQNAFGDFALGTGLVGVQNGRVGHQVADVAHKHERAAVQGHFFAIGAGVHAVRVQAAGEALAAFAHLFGQRALQNAQPVAVGQHLVVSVHHGHRVFQVKNGGQGRFQHQVRHAGRVFGANGGGAVDDDVQVQAVVLQQDRGGRFFLALEADELLGVLQAGVAAVCQLDGQLAGFHAVTHGVQVRAFAQGGGAVQHIAGVGDDLGAALGVVGLAFFAAFVFGDHVGAVQRVIQAAPAGVGGVQGVAGVQHRHHQLGAGLHRPTRRPPCGW